MERILIVSSSERATQQLCELLKSPYEYLISTADSGKSARNEVFGEEHDIVIINMPLSDESGIELAESIAASTGSGVVIIAKAEIADEVSTKCENFGTFVLSEPLSRQLFFQTLRLMSASRNKMHKLRDENTYLKGKIDEIKLINRAKLTLMQYLNMTEPMAHRYIEKRAMDMRVSKREIAENILKTYEP